jgi:hypothetical protein
MVERLRGPARRPAATLTAAAALLSAAFLFVAAAPRAGAGDCDDPVLSAPDLRICRTIDRSGRSAVVLTNLDDDGNRLAPDAGPGPAAAPRAWRETSQGEDTGTADAGAGTADAGGADPATVRVVVRGEGGDRDFAAGEVEVQGDGRGGTTVVINIDARPDPRPAVVPVVAVPVVAVGGLPGPFRYPDRQPFLGYGGGTSSPGWFGGLGLNASNNFGLKTGRTCQGGFDCMFGPRVTTP